MIIDALLLGINYVGAKYTHPPLKGKLLCTGSFDVMVQTSNGVQAAAEVSPRSTCVNANHAAHIHMLTSGARFGALDCAASSHEPPSMLQCVPLNFAP